MNCIVHTCPALKKILALPKRYLSSSLMHLVTMLEQEAFESVRFMSFDMQSTRYLKSTRNILNKALNPYKQKQYKHFRTEQNDCTSTFGILLRIFKNN